MSRVCKVKHVPINCEINTKEYTNMYMYVLSHTFHKAIWQYSAVKANWMNSEALANADHL